MTARNSSSAPSSQHKRKTSSSSSSKKSSSAKSDPVAVDMVNHHDDSSSGSDSSTVPTAADALDKLVSQAKATMKKNNSLRALLKRGDSVQILQAKHSENNNNKTTTSNNSRKKKNSLNMEMADESVKAEIQLSSKSSKKGSKKSDRRSLLERADSINISKSISTTSSSSSPKNKPQEDLPPPPPGAEESLSETLSPRRADKKRLSRQSLLQRADSIALLSSEEDDKSKTSSSSKEKHSKKKSSSKKRESKTSSSPPPKKSAKVRFDDKLVFHPPPDESGADLEEINKARWYCRQDYCCFRGGTTLAVKRIAESEDRTDACYKRVISATYISCCKAPEGTERMELPDHAEKGLNICLDKWGKRLGLELMAVPMVQDDNFQRRQKLVCIANAVQREFCTHPYEDQAEALRFGLQTESRPSALFAQCIARAVSEAVVADALENPESVTPGLETISKAIENDSDLVQVIEAASAPKEEPNDQKQQGEGPLKRGVSFGNDTSAAVIGIAANMGASKDCWYSRNEHQAFRDGVSTEVESLVGSTSDIDCRYKSSINGLYVSCCRAGKDKERTLTISGTKKENPSIFSPDVKRDLEDCLTQSSHRTGLEMMTLQCLQKDNMHRRRYHQRRVFDIQKALQDLSVESRAKMIRQGVEPVSRPSRLFAREMATTTLRTR